MRQSEAIVAVIGDVVGSRDHEDQSGMLAMLHEALQDPSIGVGILEPFRATVGDEFQATFSDFVSAFRSVILLRLLLAGRLDLRFGFGLGQEEVHGGGQGAEVRSGPAWWSAREAIEEVESVGNRHRWPRRVRMRFQGEAKQKRRLINALLVCVDEIVGRMDERDLRVTQGLLQGLQQEEIAEQLGISQGSVARRQMENGSYVLFRCLEELQGIEE